VSHPMPCPSSSRLARRPGFTLVELLVVIAIIATLVGLLLPAVQSAREAARRCGCSNNTVQLGLALHNYEFAHEAFPPGVTGDPGPIRSEPEGHHVGWIVRLLPFIEEQALASHFSIADGVYAPVNAQARAASIQTLVCPSAPIERVRDEGGVKVAVSSYAGCHHSVEAPITADNDGILFLDSRIRFSDITDGSSNTLLLGEHRGSAADLGWASGTRATLRNTSPIVALDGRHRPGSWWSAWLTGRCGPSRATPIRRCSGSSATGPTANSRRKAGSDRVRAGNETGSRPMTTPQQMGPGIVDQRSKAGTAAPLDAEAFAGLATAHRQRVLRFATAFLGDRHLAEDVVQEAFRRLFQHRGRYPLAELFGPYLVKTTARLCIDQRRSRQAEARKRDPRAGRSRRPGHRRPARPGAGLLSADGLRGAQLPRRSRRPRPHVRGGQ